MRLYLCQPEDASAVPAIVVIQNQDGVGEFTQEMTRRVAEAGEGGIAPGLYHRNTPEIKTDPQKRASRRRDAWGTHDLKPPGDFLPGRVTARVPPSRPLGFFY